MKKLFAASIVCALMPTLALADEVILDDLIVDGSQCLGQDCIEGETFGFDTLRLKENNVRIRFFDTSNSGSFPSTDWQLTANDSNNGGQSYFAIEQVGNAGVSGTPFKVLADAPSNSLLVNDSGFVGLGTATPAQKLHLVSGNAPTVRLQQDGTGGFTPIVWDISANEDHLMISADGSAVFTLEADGDLTIPGTLTAGTPGIAFPDYVFSPAYSLMPLDQLRSFLSANGHLPDIPSAGEVAANGVNMTELQVSLLKKVEELTLYTLQQQEQIHELQQQLSALSGGN